MRVERNGSRTAVRDKTVIFLHIGKTAGTTLRKILQRQFRSSEVMLVRARMRPREETLADFARLPESQRSRPRLILGHTVFGLHEYVPRPCTYVTVLRNPMSLVLSQYHFVLRTTDHRHHQVVTANNMSLEDYIQSGVSLEMNNSQTRAISGDLNTPFGQCGPEMLERAKENLEDQFSVAGLTERFDETLIMFMKAFDWSRLYYVPTNVSPDKGRREPPSEGTLELIRELNQFDFELYRYVGDRFEETIRRHPTFQQDLARFRKVNALYRPFGNVRRVVPQLLYGKLKQRVGSAR